MAYNLIDERWIPVLRQSGKVEMIAPAQIVERDDPPLRIASPRPDFDGALLEFLIGLLQTAAAPATERKWEEELESAPTVVQLKARLDTVREAFFLDGDGPRFMQDSSLNAGNSKPKPIGYLLISRAGEESIDDGPSLFAKAGEVAALSDPAVAVAVYLLQAHAPSGGGGGGGHFTSLRGGSALSAVIVADGLWATAWANVLPLESFAERRTACCDESLFPWLGKIRGADKKTGRPISSAEVHPSHAYWALPRRVLLSEKGTTACAVYSSRQPSWIGLRTATVGMRYDGLLHPLAAYKRKSESEPWLPLLTPEEGISYREWPLIACVSPSARCPKVVAHFLGTRRSQLLRAPRLASFGYAMESMKPLLWCSAETPLVRIDDHLQAQWSEQVQSLVGVAEEVRSTVVSQLRAAWSDRPSDLDFSTVSRRVSPAFWSATEPAFFRTVQALKAELEAGRTADAPKEAWLSSLHAAALALFARFTDASADLAAPDLRRVILARRSLVQFTSPGAAKLRKSLGLVAPSQPKAKASRGRGAGRRNTQESVHE
ncbi:MAG TPA: type I-E CRISPR-associated protein Cse1/CasA [Anaeromyxobacteraceae bacterium]|nr:type I-E CRISPR-associated protein Cse1/CasA [Anaeromyxobacteraceae bacterium]